LVRLRYGFAPGEVLGIVWGNVEDVLGVYKGNREEIGRK